MADAGERRSRFFRRCCPKRGSSGLKLPETPLILAGAIGGPTCIFLYTPLRNALTLASQDAQSTAFQLYSNTFEGGFTSGWTGGIACVLPSCPQFCIMGPLFHFLKEVLGSPVLAVICSAFCESTISYGSQTLNAQLAYNRDQLTAGTNVQVPLWNPLIPLGPGITVQFTRNIVALSGIRIFSKPCQAALQWFAKKCKVDLADGAKTFFGDFFASCFAAVVSAPFNQLYNFAVTSQEYAAASALGKVQTLLGFLWNSYLVVDDEGNVLGLSSTLARDLCMRCAYVAILYSTFSAMERSMVLIWKHRRKHEATN